MAARSDGSTVSAGIATTATRVVAVAAGILLASATITLAASSGKKSQTQPQAAVAKPRVLVVPDVRRQVFVFAKGILEENGFGWQVKGSVHGFAANRVTVQSPRPGARVVDTGSPKITLQLRHSGKYAQIGNPQDVSPYGASLIRTPGAEATKARAAAAKAKAAARARAKRAAATAKRLRTPAFIVAGAPREPRQGPSLPDRARRLAAWVDAHPKPSEAATQHWFSEHAWIVTGAKFGWWGGAQALSRLVKIDQRAERSWRVGSSNRELAQQALREVQAKTG
jgi:hypothetical protein